MPAVRVIVIVLGVLLAAFASQAQQMQADRADQVPDSIRERARETMTRVPAAPIAFEGAAATGSSSDASEGPYAATENDGLEIEGKITYESTYNGATGVSSFTAERIMNYRSTHSGFLKLALWATTTSPVYGGTISYHGLGEVEMNPLAGGYYYENFMTSQRPYNTPPNGTYYISMVLLEYSNGAYYYKDIRTFDKTWTIGGTSVVPCSPTTSKFCAHGNRFSVSLWARDQRTGATDKGNVMLSTSVYGMFAFPVLAGNTTDPQVFVKVLDGRPINGKWWVFCSTLTDVEFKVTVTDTQTGQSRVYHKLAGTTSSTFDTGAF
jgi:hypothetical protein